MLKKLYVLMINLVKKFIEAILEENRYCKQMIKKHSNKNLVMSAEDERRFQLSNKCWICNKLIVAGNDKVRDHDHVTGKYRGSAHDHVTGKYRGSAQWSHNINLKLNEKYSCNIS